MSNGGMKQPMMAFRNRLQNYDRNGDGSLKRQVRSTRRFAAVLLSVALIVESGCGEPPAIEAPVDLVIKPDGTVFLSTGGTLYRSQDQGATWEPFSVIEQLSQSNSIILDNLIITPDNVILGWDSYALTVAAICDDGATFRTLRLDLPRYSRTEGFVMRPGQSPLLLDSYGQLYELTGSNGCPDEIRKLGVRNPSVESTSAAVCGDAIYQAGAGRIFRSVDQANSWELDWDFFEGNFHLDCQSGELWGYDSHKDVAFRRDDPSGQWIEVGSLGVNFPYNVIFHNGNVFVMRRIDFGKWTIHAMSIDGTLHHFPPPPSGNEIDFHDFEIAPDGVFWLASRGGVYRDDASENWTKVWP